ncbi:hypothetical protein KDA_20960 [Dictyobacter alpinus]|uniref:Peptidase M48 domain-containing protein n=1 Tax=Dictyobacter alpinus TaxID=2014873 RepID=A0A402B5I0_9CHLR|nr:M48 family metalloprotease [Dictyobacter alpinus]GCE26612.1 hypothetical protein KDA_20960 [Dictyobacter alpinus]
MQQINEERQRRLLAYRNARRVLVRLLAIPFLFLLGSLFCIYPQHSWSLIGLTNALWHRLMAPFLWPSFFSWHPLPLLCSYLLCMCCFELLYLPLYFYLDYDLKRYHRLPTSSLWTCVLRHCRNQSRLVVKWALLVQVIYLLEACLQEWWFCAFAGLQLLLDIFVAQRQPAAMARTYTLTRLVDGELAQRLHLLMQRLSTSVKGIYIVTRPGTKMAPTAFVIGWGWTRTICIAHTTLERFSLDEIEVIMAHELSHHIHADIWRHFLVRTGVRTMLYFLLSMLLVDLVNVPIYFFSGTTDSATMPFLLSFFVLSWLLTRIIMNRYSRYTEYRADEFALSRTGKYQAFKTTMVKLANINTLLAHDDSYSSHPSIVSRIQHADEFAARGV